MLIVASGNVVHNLRLVDRARADEGFDWAQRFDDAVCDQMRSDPSNILEVTGYPDYAKAVPTPDHFIPLLYVAGLASKQELPKAMLRGYSMGSLSMTAYSVGAAFALDDDGAAAASLPTGIPADDTNA